MWREDLLNWKGSNLLEIICRCLIGLLVFGLARESAAEGTIRFTDVTAESGIDFLHTNCATGQKFVPETVGSGGGFLDYDNDGHLDIYLLNGAAAPGTECPGDPKNKLYHNEGDGTFKDVTATAGVGDAGYGMGCAAADIDNDGDIDLYISNVRANVLYRNEGNGTFTDITAVAEVGDEWWGTSCAFADADNDSYVDLYVGNYHDFTYDNQRFCAEGGSGLQLYCGPEAYDGVADVFYFNDGDGTFTDATAAVGLANGTGKELGVVFGDVDLDGDQDLYLANDKTSNFLYINDGKGNFEETGLMAGTAYNEDGDVEAGMGVAMGDYDNDKYPDLFITNFQWETNTLYRNLGDGSFVDETLVAGLADGSIPFLSWGTQFSDLDNDGDRDVFISTGHLESDVEQYESTTFAQRNQLYINDGKGRFEEETDVEGSAMGIRKVSRGAAFGDYDNDGDVDILVTNIADTPTLMRNDGSGYGNWLRIRLEGTRSNRSALGARVEVICGPLEQVEEVRSGSSFLSQNDLRLHFGLGSATRADRVRVFWPSGLIEEVENIAANGEITLIEGQN
ncbi:MAG: CRTAC1 family protein [Gemmatimonadetes bacterium]|jgi:enediyne biosynthesis protein E4|nr:CRTAC1 family protein [Gemmatimonadota bacterium]